MVYGRGVASAAGRHFWRKIATFTKMADNGGAGAARRRNGSRRAPTVKKAKTKKLGRVALAAITHNEMIVDEFIAAKAAGVESPYELAVIKANPASEHPGTWAFGGGAFSVQLANGRYVRAHLRKLLQGRGRFHYNPDVMTAARDGSHVLVEDLGFSGRSGGMTHQIMAVLSADQAARVHMNAPARRSSSARSSSGNGGWEFNRNAAAYTNAAERRAATVANAMAARAGAAVMAAAKKASSPSPI